MRERILEAIYQQLDKDPTNTHLQRQLTLLNRANICTIHSFCLEVIRNHFYAIDCSANFRIGDTAEMELLQQEALEEIFEEKYLEKDPAFIAVLDLYTDYRDDTNLKDMLLAIYHFIQSSPFPEEWLAETIQQFSVTEQDFAQTIWGKILCEETKEKIEDGIIQLQGLQRQMAPYEADLLPCIQVLQRDIEELQTWLAQPSWDAKVDYVPQIEWKRWPSKGKNSPELQEEIKNQRTTIKKKVMGALESYFTITSAQAIEDITYMYPYLETIQHLVHLFIERFAQKKKERNVVDFNDIEHFALQILVQKKEQDNIEETEIAKQYQQKFVEIAVDEYQDSNLVQEYILKSISKGNNLFMVGDVKQSIYKFRQARPDLFMQKYTTYTLWGEGKPEENRKIQLFKNFRSRENILQVTNRIFQNIMSMSLGEMDYTQEEYLHLGADYPTPTVKGTFAGKTELHILDMQDPEKDTTFFEEEEEEVEPIENIELEAKFVAKKMKELLESNYQVWDKKKGYRPITYKDIAVLLRSTQTTAPIFEKELVALDIPVFSDTQTGYLDSFEVQTILSLLKIIDNPMQDIPLVHCMRSSIGGFSDDELVQIRLVDRNVSFYEALRKAPIQVEDSLRQKIENFLERLEKWRNRKEQEALDTFLWYLYQDTNFYHYVGLLNNGAFRQANLKILFEKAKEYEKANFRGLFQFIHFIEQLHKYSGDFGAAKLIGENENVVRLMSIHKSKGLEFPVVFLCGTGKQVNMQDTTQNIVLHPELGMGPKYKNLETKLEYNTLAKEAIKHRMVRETLSEEMRVLYVALTRAREKLIITGIDKEAAKHLEEKEQALKLYPYKEKLDSKLVKHYKRYIDWIELAYLQDKEASSQEMELCIHSKKEILQSIQLTKEEKTTSKVAMFLEEARKKENKQELQAWKQWFQWQYPLQELCYAPTKTSVTQLKQHKQKKEETITEAVPQFLKPEKAISKARRGTLVHLCLQKLPEQQEHTKESLQKFIQELVQKGILLEQEANVIPISTLWAFTQSAFYQELQQAQEIHKEQPFYTSAPIQMVAEEISKEAKETVLVQGIMDVYFRDKAGKWVLADYKTDVFEPGEESMLIERYREQLQLYQKALEEALQEKVDRIYLIALGRTDGNIQCLSVL